MADTNDQRKQQKRQRLRHKEQMLGQLKVLAAHNTVAAAMLNNSLPPIMAMAGTNPVIVNANMAFDPIRNSLLTFFTTQQKYFDQLIRDTEMEIELMRKYDV